jgi:predicted nucleic acid-binding protein
MRPKEMPRTSDIVLDTCVISNFALGGALAILQSLPRVEIHTTDIVALEIMRGIQSGRSLLEAVPEAVRAGWLRQTGLRSGREKALFELLSGSCGLGEASCLAVAKVRRFILASDDRMARTEAAGLGIRLTGTVGILAKAVRGGVCDLGAADACLGKMIDAGFYSPLRSLREVLSHIP